MTSITAKALLPDLWMDCSNRSRTCDPPLRPQNDHNAPDTVLIRADLLICILNDRHSSSALWGCPSGASPTA